MDGYPLLNLFFTMLYFFLFVAWISLLVNLLADIFRSRDMSGAAKALWTLFIIVVPWLGALLYLIVRGDRMHERLEADAVRTGAARTNTASTADELGKLADLRDAGVITADEFQTQKARLLA